MTRGGGVDRRPWLLSRRRLLASVAGLGATLAGGHALVRAQTQPAISVNRGPTDRAVVALTFDCGSDRGNAEFILDTLASKGVPCSFGLTGVWAEANGDLVQRMAREGHDLINHTWSHPSFTGATTNSAPLSAAARREQLESTEEMLVNLTGIGGRPMFRPPYGDVDSSVLADLGNARFTHNIMWTIDVLGWQGLSQGDLIWRVENNHGNGYIYLMHVGGQSQEGAALPRIIDALRARGYGFVTIRDLLATTSRPVAPPLPVFEEGDGVRVTAELQLRTAPNLSGQILATMPAGTIGTVLAGPSPADGYIWYQLETELGTGWSVVDRLMEASVVDQVVAAIIRIIREILGQT